MLLSFKLGTNEQIRREVAEDLLIATEASLEERPLVVRYDFNPEWQASVEALMDECDASPGDPAPCERLNAYLKANNDRAVTYIPVV